MVHTVRKTISLFLVVSLFGTSLGFSVFSHICLLNGNKEISLRHRTSCCADAQTEHKDLTLMPVCCNDGLQWIKLSYAGFTQTSLHLFVFMQAIPANLNILSPLTENALYLAPADLPPPKTGRTLLAEQQIFLI